MFCTQCGTHNPEGANNCTTCGAILAVEAKPAASKKFDPVALFNQLRNSKFFIPGIAGGAGLILLIVLLVVLLGGGKTKPIDRALTGLVKTDAEKYISAYPDDYIEYIEEENDYDVDDTQDYLEYFMEMAEEEIGDKIKYKYEVTKEKELSKKKLDELKEELNEDYGLSKREITEAWELEIDLTLSGSEDDESGEITVIVIKYKGKWYISPNSGIF